MYSLEEFPPPPRRVAAEPAPRKATRWIPSVAFVLLVAALPVAGYTRLSIRLSDVNSELEVAREALEEVHGSLGLLWSTTTRLDESRMAQQDVLRDSIGRVRNFAEGGMRLWEAAFEDHERRLAGNAARLVAQQEHIDRLLKATTDLDTRVVGVAGQGRSLEAGFALASRTVSSLRDSLALLGSQLVAVETRLADARADQARTAGRVDGMELWVDAFREQDLDAGVVRERLAALASDLRLIASRVDSLGSRTDSARAGLYPPGPR